MMLMAACSAGTVGAQLTIPPGGFIDNFTNDNVFVADNGVTAWATSTTNPASSSRLVEANGQWTMTVGEGASGNPNTWVSLAETQYVDFFERDLVFQVRGFSQVIFGENMLTNYPQFRFTILSEYGQSQYQNSDGIGFQMMGHADDGARFQFGYKQDAPVDNVWTANSMTNNAPVGFFPTGLDFAMANGGTNITVTFLGENDASTTYTFVVPVGPDIWGAVGERTSHSWLRIEGRIGTAIESDDYFDFTFGSLAVIPEPATAGLVALALAAVAARRRRACRG